MVKQLLLSGALIFSSISITSAQLAFQKVMAWFGSEEGKDIQQTPDGGYIIAGRTNAFGAGSHDVLLIKTNVNGDTLWARTYGGISGDYGTCVQLTPDGGYTVAGFTNSFSAAMDVYLLKTDSIGNLLWSKTYGGTSGEWVYSLQLTADGGYIITGSTNSFSAGDDDVYLIKTDSIGNLLWSKTYGGAGQEWGNFVRQTADGGFIVTGFSSSFGAGGDDVFLIKTDSNGDTLWTRTFGGTDLDAGGSVQQTSDGGYIIAGYSRSFSAFYFNALLIKTDSIGNLLWSKTYGGPDEDFAYNVEQTIDGGYILTGSTESFGAGDIDFYLIKTDANGDTLFTKAFGGLDYEDAFSVHQTQDNGYVITGYSWSWGLGGQNVYLIKTNSTGSSGCNEYSTATIVTAPAIQIGGMAAIITSPATIVTTPATIVNGGGANVYTFCDCYAYFTLYADTIPHNWIAVNMASGAGPLTYLWNWGDSTTSSGPTPSHIYNTPGYYNICLTISDSTGCTNTYCDSSTYIFRGNVNNTVITINVVMPGSTNVLEQNTIKNEVSIFPNPTSGNFVITFSRIVNEGRIEFYNMLGKGIHSEKIISESNKEINFKNISSGIYFVKVFDGEKSYCKKLIVE